MNNINIIIPTYNEDKNILFLIKKIKKYVPDSKICIVDDSKENKIEKILKDNNFNKIAYYHRKNKKGRGSAVIFGFKKLLNKNINQIFIEMDADFSHRPSELKRNIKLFKKKKSDLLISSRYLKNSKILNWPLSRRILSKLSNYLAKFILKIDISDYTNGFRIYSSNSINLIIKKCGHIGDGFIVLSEILIAIKINNLRINETHSIFVNRVRGESSVNIKLMLNSLIGLLKLFLLKKKYKI
jgi:dolichol-phosphate mannosyltransferase|tara:strand:+ start:2154 stop:2876 length:723 start_codon:yes stop_codon:yes gene_type:complete